MMYKNSTLYLIATLSAISALILGLILGCDEKKIKSPVTGSAAGSGPIGGGDAQKIRLTANPSSTITAVGEEQATVKITAIVENNIGQPMPDGTVVYWTATVGTLDSVTTTTSNGASTVTLTFPEAFSGSSVITAISGDAKASITVKVANVTPTPTITTTPTPTTGFVVSAAQTTIAHQGTTTITAFVSKNGQPESGLQVNFSVSGVGILQESAATTDASGNATVVLIGNNTSGNDQTATVTATTVDGRSGTVSVIVTGGATPTPVPTATPVKGFVVSAENNTIKNGESTEISVFASVNGIPDKNLQVNFTVSGAGILDASAATTDASGQASITLTGKNQTINDSTATVTATTADGRSGSVTVTVISTLTPTATPEPMFITLSNPTPATISCSPSTPANTAQITATAYKGGLATPGVSISFSLSPTITGMSISPDPQITDSLGQATVTIIGPVSSDCTAPVPSQLLTIKATATGYTPGTANILVEYRP